MKEDIHVKRDVGENSILVGCNPNIYLVSIYPLEAKLKIAI